MKKTMLFLMAVLFAGISLSFAEDAESAIVSIVIDGGCTFEEQNELGWSNNSAYNNSERFSRLRIGSTVRLHIQPYPGKIFLGWGDCNTNLDTTFVVKGDVKLYARVGDPGDYEKFCTDVDFVAEQYIGSEIKEISKVKKAYPKGVVPSPEGLVECPETTAETEYRCYWNEAFVPADENKTYTMTVEATPRKYFLSAMPNDEDYGYVEGSGSYKYGDKIYIVAGAKKGYGFDRWSDGVETPGRYITVQGDTNVTAIFKKTYTVDFVLHLTEWTYDTDKKGLVEQPKKDSTVSLTVVEGHIPNVPDETEAFACNSKLPMGNGGEKFVECSWDKEIAPVTADVRYELTKVTKEELFEVTYNYVDSDYKKEIKKEWLPYGATPVYPEMDCPEHNSHYEFHCTWNPLHPGPITRNVSYDYKVMRKHIIVVEAVPNDLEAGHVSGTGIFEAGQKVIFTAKAYDGYVFVEWSDGVKSPRRVYEGDEGISLIAIFAKLHDVCLTLIDVKRTYDDKAKSFKEQRNEKRKCMLVKNGDMPEYDEADYECPVVDSVRPQDVDKIVYECSWNKKILPTINDEDYVFTKVERPREYEIQYYYEKNWSKDRIFWERVPYGKTPDMPKDVVCPENDAKHTYSCGWDKDPAPVTGNGSYTYSVTWTVNQYVVSVSANNSRMGKVQSFNGSGVYLNESGVYRYESLIHLVAEPNEGCAFDRWSDGDSNSTRVIKVVEDLNLVANFVAVDSRCGADESTTESVSLQVTGKPRPVYDASVVAAENQDGEQTMSTKAAVAPRFSVTTVARDIQVAGARVGSSYEVFDMQGRLMQRGCVENADFSLTMPQAGTYLLRIAKQVQKVTVR